MNENLTDYLPISSGLAIPLALDFVCVYSRSLWLRPAFFEPLPKDPPHLIATQLTAEREPPQIEPLEAFGLQQPGVLDGQLLGHVARSANALRLGSGECLLRFPQSAFAKIEHGSKDISSFLFREPGI